MRTLLMGLFAIAALTVPSAALAHDGNGGHNGHRGHGHHHGVLAALAGTGTSFGGATATASGSIKSDALNGGTFTASISTDAAKATTKTSSRGTLSCAPATATVTLTGAVTANAVTSALTGKTCTWTKSDGTVFRGFFGKGTANGDGTLASLDGKTDKAFLTQKADGTVQGSVFVASARGERNKDEGTKDERDKLFSVREHAAAHETGDCDKNK